MHCPPPSKRPTQIYVAPLSPRDGRLRCAYKAACTSPVGTIDRNIFWVPVDELETRHTITPVIGYAAGPHAARPGSGAVGPNDLTVLVHDCPNSTEHCTGYVTLAKYGHST